MITVENAYLTYYNEKEATIKGISFHVKKGTITGLIGHNGAGKTTLIKMICGLLMPEKYDKIEINGRAVSKKRKLNEVGLILGESQLYDDLTAYENIIYYLKLNKVKKSRLDILNMLNRVGLINENRKLVSDFSTGMKQKLNIAKVLLCDKKLIILDEPTSGMDPIAKNEINQLLLTISREENITILLSSHAMKEVEKICDYVLFLNEGEIIYSGRTKDIKNNYEPKVREVYTVEQVGNVLCTKLDENKMLYYKTIHNGYMRVVIMGMLDLISIDNEKYERVVIRDLELEDIFFHKILGA